MARIPVTRTGRGVESRGQGQRGTVQEGGGRVAIPGVARDPGLSVNADQFGASVGRALTGVGAGLGALGQAAQLLAERRRETEDKVFLATARKEYNQRLFQDEIDRQAGFQSGEDALGAFGESSARIKQEVMAELQEKFSPSKAALETFEANSIQIDERYGLRTITFENNQKVAQYANEYDGALADMERSVFNAGSLAEAEVLMDQHLDALSDVLPPDKIDALRDQTKRKLSLAHLNGLGTDDPAGLFDALNGGTAAGIVGAIIQQESGGTFTARGKDGEGGAMQVMPDTARRIAREMGDPNFPHNGTDEDIRLYLIDEENKGANGIRYGTFEINRLLRKYNGDVEAALIGYNGGDGSANKWLASGRDDRSTLASRRGYHKQVLKRMGDASGEGDTARALNNVTASDQMRLHGIAERGRKVRQAEYMDRLEDHLANIELTGQGLDGFDVSEADGVLDPDAALAAAAAEDRAFAQHDALRDIYYGPASVAGAAVADARPIPGTSDIEQQQSDFERRQKALQQRINATDRSAGSDDFDPAGWAAQGNEDVQVAYSNAIDSGDPDDMRSAVRLSREAQREIGVLEQDIQPLTNQMAAQLLGELRATPVDEQGAKLENMITSFGEFGGDVTDQLIAAGLPPAVAAASLYIDDPILSQEVITASANRKEVEDSLPSTTVKDTKEGIAAEMEEFRASFQAADYTGASAAPFNNMKDAVTSVALLRASRGDTNATENTIEDMINSRFHTTLFGGTAWAPATFRETDIEISGDVMRTRAALEDFGPVGFGDPAAPDFLDAPRIMENALNNGMWATNEMGDGLVFMVPIGGGFLPIVNEDGKFHEIKFQDAASISRVAFPDEVGLTEGQLPSVVRRAQDTERRRRGQ